jgi:signal transduction histidine kinase
VRSAVLTLAGLLLAIAASRSLARRLARPILRLRRGAERIAGGDLATRIDVRTGDEVEALARQFNVMADQLEDYTTGLQQKVAEKTQELELANRHKSEFLANMSHELRTPLNAVIGFSEALKERMFGDLNPKQMEYVQDIHASGQHLLSLINDILDLSKIEAGRMELDVRRFDVASALENCRTLIRERALRQGLALEFRVEEGLGTWKADERKFKQIVLNLLTNAVKFTPAGGKVQVRAANGGDWLEVIVADTGPGIAPSDHQVIFEEFRQLRAEGESKNEGTGLGLALTRRLVQLHGGEILLDSAVGHGATFIVRLPREPAATQA